MAKNTTNNQYLWLTSYAGMFSSSIARIICHPFDTIKAKLYIQRDRIVTFSDFKNVVASTYRQEGLKGFYRGVGISVVGSAPAFSFYLTMYEWFKQRQLTSNASLNHFFSGFGAEAVSCIIWLPIDVVKERLQVQQNLGVYRYSGSMNALMTIIKQEGLRGLYRGYGATLGFFGTHSAFYFAMYEYLKTKICKDISKPRLTESVANSIGAYLFASIISNPLDIARLRLQVQRIQGIHGENPSANFGYLNQLHGLYLVYRHEGIYAFYRGYPARLLHGGSTTTITMTLAEYIRNHLKQLSTE